MNFDFGSLATVQLSSDIKYLKPYNIYDNVSYDGYEITQGTSEKGNNWKRLTLTFKSKEGIYKESIFYFDHTNQADITRPEFDMPNGGKREAPSKAENVMAEVAAIGHAFNPEGFKKMQQISSKFKSCDDVLTALVKILEQTKGKVQTSMKLVGRNNNGRVYASLPKPLGIIQEDNGTWRTFPVAMFGENLTFSSYEMGKKQEYESAKPTNMDTTVENNIDASVNTEEIDFESLL